jgi:phosphoribosylaminoimidazolecarboxamide formyltransferase/IMP cyclohydrolase
MKKRALISVYKKDNILTLAKFLAQEGWEIISTGGTGAFLRSNGVPVIDISELTGFPECLDGRVKTLHPAVHAGILARRGEKSHIETLERLNISAIDLVAVNLYPFFEKVGEGLSQDETVEFIDIGGPTLLRSAAKNYHDVIVLSDPDDYGAFIDCLKNNSLSDDFRKQLAGKVYNLTSAYDAAVGRFLLQESMPKYYEMPLKKATTLRYGENAHQKAGLYLNADIPGAMGAMEQLNGKEMGYNNIRDLDLAWKSVCAFGLDADGTPPIGGEKLKSTGLPGTNENSLCCVTIKHNTPCGISLGRTVNEAFSKAYTCDPVSIFGGIAAFNAPVDEKTAKKLTELFLEIVIAPDFSPGAIDCLKKKPDLRVIKAKKAPKELFESVSVDGGLLVQESNRALLAKWEVVTKTQPDTADIQDMIFGVRAVSWVKSNAIVVVKDGAAVGIGGGETNRIWAAELALNRAVRTVAAAAGVAMPVKRGGASLSPSLADCLSAAFTDGAPARVLASDAFFPFPDVVEAAAAAGIKAIIQPGGSNNDSLSIEACDRLGIAMVFTGTRYFKH